MSKTPAELDREIQEAVGLPPAVTKKWRTKLAAAKKALRELEASYSEPAFWKAVKTRDALDKFIDEACGYVPYAPGAKVHLAPPIVAMQEERKALFEGGLEPVSARGRDANARARAEESKRLREEEREKQRPYDWMKR